MDRRHFLQAAATAALVPSALMPAWARAQSADWPKSPIKLVVPFPPGGGTDTVSRLVAEKLTVLDKWQVIVDNRPGAAGNIGLDQVSKARPDGYTLAMAQTSNMAINPALYASMPFDPLKDLTPIVEVCAQPVVLVVRNESPFKTLADLVQAAKREPGKYTVAQAGLGTVGHLAGEMLVRAAGIQMMQVPYKGAGPAMTDLLGGQVDTYFGSAASVMPQLQARKIRGLAVTSAHRLPGLPDLPTVAEQGYADFEATTWLGLVGPAGLPPNVVAAVNAAVNAVVARKEVQDRLLAEGNAPLGGTAQAFAQVIQGEHAKWGKLIREAKIKVE
ncbi:MULTISPECIES: tripartite tricarboxylate transporter substrate binding protein [unclassified Achromobacter]|uniref:Bug family tripartite tricarboxylate transporter substrate binding protein n=1 Tax=unclassified Achromobacter TaxID=2626865 RepID=UPI000B51960C|nr:MULTISPECIES: tripartite tricarboxylate transporter substrate binding protein [unclassified Achromobacter]OWT72757.1 LacI family transcriptional regulator [Achromobacter sp. HZ34]OWT73976.1 LacI family transcriptional regulator [Achromobacter sp. HZ28]